MNDDRSAIPPFAFMVGLLDIAWLIEANTDVQTGPLSYVPDAIVSMVAGMYVMALGLWLMPIIRRRRAVKRIWRAEMKAHKQLADQSVQATLDMYRAWRQR